MGLIQLMFVLSLITILVGAVIFIIDIQLCINGKVLKTFLIIACVIMGITAIVGIIGLFAPKEEPVETEKSITEISVITIPILMLVADLGTFEITEKEVSVDVLDYINEDVEIVRCSDCTDTVLNEITTYQEFWFLTNNVVTYQLVVPEGN